jgi:predicted nucleotidyltransferase
MVTAAKDILMRIKRSVQATDPDATIILYGSFARGDYKDDSDLDLIILLDKDKVERDDEIRIKYPLYEIEFDTGQIISPLVLSRTKWETKHRITPFYENVAKEGIRL